MAQNNWVTVSQKRPRTPEKAEKSAKQRTTLEDYWLNPVPQTNRFNALQIEDGQETEMTSEASPAVKVQKPPPIFVAGVGTIQPLIQQLEITARDGYFIKVLNDDQVKIQPKTPEDYSAIIKALSEKKTKFHTFQMKQDRSYRVVLKNIHHSTDITDITAELQRKNHTVRSISNIKERITKRPLPMFFVELAPKDNNKDIYNIEVLLQCRVKIEPPHQKREIPQCLNCQRYGHTKRFCHHTPRCVKCAGEHVTAECARKEKSKDVKCVHCEGNHPANYKGCSIYKELQKRKFPTLRPKLVAQITPEGAPSPLRPVNQGISYAQATKGGTTQTQSPLLPTPTSITQEPSQQNHILHTEQTSDMSELKFMMKTLMEQMGTMLNLLTTVIAKIAQ